MTRARKMRRLARQGPNVWVVRRGRKYAVTEERTGFVLTPPISQRLAIRVARLIARANRSELIVQARTGKIRIKDSHGIDPFPPRG